jgi:putative endonuclease
LYTGITTDVQRRFAEHQAQGNKTAKYLRGKNPLSLVFSLQIGNRSAASKIEHQIKQLPKSQKELLIQDRTIIDIVVCHDR